MGEILRRDAVIKALLPDVPFDGWTEASLRAAAERVGVDAAELTTLFPRGAVDAVAWFSHWADRMTLEAMAVEGIDDKRLGERVAMAARTRLKLLLPHREAVRRGLSLLALPGNAARGLKLLYDTVDALWHAAGDEATDFSFYTKRATLAGLYAAVTLYWLDDRSEGATATEAFLERRLRELGRLPRARAGLSRLAEAVPHPLRFFRLARRRS